MAAHPHGPRVGAAEIRRRLTIVEETYLRYGTAPSTIRAIASIPGPGKGNAPAIPLSIRTRRRYVRAVEKLWALQDRDERWEQRRKDFLRFLRSVIRRAEGKGQTAVVVRGLELLAKVQGLHGPEVLEVHATVTGGEDFEGWTVEEIDAYQAAKARARGLNGTGLKLLPGGNGKTNGRNGTHG